ncbi:MAG: cupin domain-containing protein [Candidatus Komeilibacteria bacterium]|nr:cupin domain-containing protein [Candidatus Komeilibacteria bacterium]
MTINASLPLLSKKRLIASPSIQDIKLVENLHIRRLNQKHPTNFKNIIISKPWGAEYLCGRNKNVEIWELYINPKSSTSLHCHPEKDTLNLILEGELIFETVSKKEILRAGDCKIIKAGTIHRTTNNNPESTSRLLEIESPPNKYNLIRIQDSYGRESLGYVPLKLKKISVKKIHINHCLVNNFKTDAKNNYTINKFMFKKGSGVNKSIGINELLLHQISFENNKKDLIKKLESLSVKNLIVLQGSLAVTKNNVPFKLLPGDCIFNTPLWKLNWSSKKVKNLIW